MNHDHACTQCCLAIAALRQDSLLVGLEQSPSFHETGGAAQSAGFQALQPDAARKVPASTRSLLRCLFLMNVGSWWTVLSLQPL